MGTNRRGVGMTREEALKWFKDRKKMNLDDKCQQAEDMAIKALEQEPILDKIRAEIADVIDYKEPAYKAQDNFEGGLQVALQIIDKYRKEN